MSLFSAREWWSFSPGEPEECDTGCLCVANIDNSSDGAEKIITGNFQGVLRVFNPAIGIQKGEPVQFNSRHLLFEQKLDAPILQLCTGRFTEGRGVSLAILHPQSLAVYVATKSNTRVEMDTLDDEKQERHQSDNKPEAHCGFVLEKVYEHRLNRAAYNFCTGAFGNVSGSTNKLSRQSVCVQSIDGELTFLEGDTATYVRHLKDPLVPGPILYVPETDSILTVDANMELQCFSFQSIVMCEIGADQAFISGGTRANRDQSSNRNLDMNDKSLSTSRKRRVLEPTWTVNLGEHAYALYQCRVAESSNDSCGIDIVVCGESTIFHIAADTGVLKSQRHIEIDVAAAQSFPVSPSLSHSLVISHQNTLSVYSETKLVWTARLSASQAPVVQTATTSFLSIKGLIVMLRDDGELSVSYLGTSPAILDSRLGTTREVDFQKLEAELKQTQRRIRALTSGKAGAGVAVSEKIRQKNLIDELEFLEQAPDALLLDSVTQAVSEQARKDLSSGVPVLALKAGVLSAGGLRRRPKPSFPQSDKRFSNLSLSDNGQVRYAALDLSLEWTSGEDRQRVDVPNNVDSINISVIAAPGLIPLDSYLTIPRKGQDARHTLYIAFSSVEHLCLDAQVTINAAYTTPERDPRVVSVTLAIPLDQLVTPCLPTRSAPVMFTVDVNRDEPISLLELFPDLVAQASSGAGASPGNSDDVSSIVAAKGITAHAIGVMYPTNACVTVLLSRRASRYRVQTASLAALSHMLNEIASRLQSLHSSRDGKRAEVSGAVPTLLVSISPQESPLSHFLLSAEKHVALRQSKLDLQEELEKQCNLYRAIQRRILQRMKDKLPTGLNKLDVLMAKCAEQIKFSSTSLLDVESKLNMSESELCAASSAMLLILKLWFNLDTRTYEYLRSIFPKHRCETDDLGWIELTATGIVNTVPLLKSNGSLPEVQSDSDKKTSRISNALATTTEATYLNAPISAKPTSSQNVKIVQRFTWLLQHVCDKLSNGYRIFSSKGSSENSKQFQITVTKPESPQGENLPQTHRVSSILKTKPTVHSQLPENIKVSGPSVISIANKFAHRSEEDTQD